MGGAKRWSGLKLDQPHVMGIINVTPDSFSDGGQFHHVDQAILHGRQLSNEGASILDVGGESTRPGATPVGRQQELDRVLPVVSALAQEGFLVSIDTRHPEIMVAAAKAGAKIINDVSGFTNASDSISVAVDLALPVCLMHMRGTPQTMQNDPRYDDAAKDIARWLHHQADKLIDAGLDRQHICLDPGIGFGKTLRHNLSILQNWPLYEAAFPAMLGASRKGFIEKIAGDVEPARRLPGSLVAATAVYRKGCRLFRVHDVAATLQALAVEQALMAGA